MNRKPFVSIYDRLVIEAEERKRRDDKIMMWSMIVASLAVLAIGILAAMGA